MSFIKLILIHILLLFSTLGFSCSELYIDRRDYSEIVNFDLDILDEYSLEKPILLKNPLILNSLEKLIKRLNFTSEPKINKLIRSDFLRKTLNLKIYPIKSLKHPYRNGFLVQEALNKRFFYSFILYLAPDCSF